MRLAKGHTGRWLTDKRCDPLGSDVDFSFNDRQSRSRSGKSRDSALNIEVAGKPGALLGFYQLGELAARFELSRYNRASLLRTTKFDVGSHHICCERGTSSFKVFNPRLGIALRGSDLRTQSTE